MKKQGVEQPDPAASFAASLSIYNAANTKARAYPHEYNLSEAYGGGDEFMRQCARVGTYFESWATANIDFGNSEIGVWPYDLEASFGTYLLELLNPDRLQDFNVGHCVSIATKLGCSIV